jgi:uncharacterized membrane protein YqjE
MRIAPLDTHEATKLPPNERQTFAKIFRELIVAFNEVAKGEIRLAKAEIKNATSSLRRDVFRLVIFSSLAVAGLLPLMAFLVIGLGQLLGDHYLWSSLIVALLFIGIGGAVSYQAFKKATQLDYTLPHTMQSFEERLEFLNQKLNQLAQAGATSAAESITPTPSNKRSAA